MGCVVSLFGILLEVEENKYFLDSVMDDGLCLVSLFGILLEVEDHKYFPFSICTTLQLLNSV